MTKARTLANFISDGSTLADGAISVSEVSGAAPLASPSFTGTVDVANNMTVGGNDTIISENNVGFKPSGAAYFDHHTVGQGMYFRLSNASSLDRTVFELGPDFATFNNGGHNQDFRVESDNLSYMLFVDAGADHVNIGTGTDLGGRLNVNGSVVVSYSDPSIASLTIEDTGTSQAGLNLKAGSGSTNRATRVNFFNNVASSSTPRWSILNDYYQNGDNGFWIADSVGNKFLTLTSNQAEPGSGNFIINEDNDDINFRVESDNNANMLFVDAGNDRVGIGQGFPRSGLVLDVAGDIGQTWIDGEQFVGQQYSTGSYRLGIITDSGDRTAQLVANAGDSSGKLEFYTNSNRAGLVSNSNDWTFFEGVTINENGGNNDFRVEGNNVSNGIVYDADDETVCFFTSITSSTLSSGINFKRDGANNSYQNIAHTPSAGDGYSYIQFMYNSGRIGQAVQSGTTGVTYQTTSDYRLKENAVPITSATERVKQLNPIRFNFISEPDRTIDGFLAHEVQTVVPEAVSGTKDEVDSDGNPEYQGLDTSRLVPVLVATIKELEARITALENA